MRYLASACGAGRMFGQQLVAVEMEIADERHVDCRRHRAAPGSGHRGGGLLVLTVMRTSSEPARASASTCVTVASTSAVSVLVIDCTTIGR